jgi:fibronectin type 3 domain-containing protein
VNSATIQGSGFSVVGGSFPITLNPKGSTTLTVQFKPAVAGAVTGTLAISSNATSGGTATVSLKGTGTAVAREVDLTWTAPANSPSSIAGYNVYRSVGSGGFQKMNSSTVTQTAYADNTASSGTTYNYYVTSVDQNTTESVPSNQIALTIP